MGAAAVPLLVGTGIQIIGANQGWDPRFTALASIAAGGIGAGMTSGAFSGATAAQAATGVASSVNPHAGMLSNAFTPQAGSAVAGAVTADPFLMGGQGGLAEFATTPSSQVLGATDLMGGQGSIASSAVPYKSINPHAGFHSPQAPPTWRTPAVDAVKAPFFDRTQYTYKEQPYKLPDGTMGSQQVRMPKVDANGNIVKGMSQADALGVNMLDTFMQYELALAKQPKPRPTRSGGGGGGGGGGPAASYQGGGGSSGQKQVTWGFGGGNNNGYQPQGLV